MYQVIGISSGVIMVSFLQRGAAEYWLECNDYDNEGFCYHLYKIVKTK